MAYSSPTPSPAPVTPQPARRRRKPLMVVSGIIAAVCAWGLFLLPSPYIVEAPGPTEDTLGQQNGNELIQTTSAPSHPVTGQLRMVTVTAYGTNGDLGVVLAVRGWLSGQQAVIPYTAVYPRNMTDKQRDEVSTLQMSSSQDSAVIAASEKLGIPVTMTINSTVTDAAKAVLKPKDTLVALNGTKLTGFGQLSAMLRAIPAGTAVTLTVGRGGATQQVELVTSKSDAGGSMLGVTLTFATPLTIKYGVEGIGGSSAGMMFTLGIIDKVGPTDLAAGKVIAGTGTISADGTVGAIGGIRQKMIAAKRDGAAYFLAPVSNCSDVVGNVPKGLQVIEVSTLDDALNALAKLRAGQGAKLPTCTATSH